MKNFLLLIVFFGAFLAALIFAPSYLPKDVKKKIVYYKLQNYPGAFEIEAADFDLYQGITLEGFSWKIEDYEIHFPELKIANSLFSLFFEKKYRLLLENGILTYKDKNLLTGVSSQIPLQYREETLHLQAPTEVTASVEKEGTKQYTNHSLVPSFSAEKVVLSLEKASIHSKGMKTLNMQGILNLNTLDCSKNHFLSVVLSLLQSKPKHIIPVTFRPIPFTSEGGILSYRRTDFLIDNAFDLITKGTINLNAQTLNLHFGLTSDSLAKALDITDLPDGYIIPFRVKGDIKNPKLDTAKAIQSIAALILLQKIDPKSRTLPNPGLF